MNLSGIMIGGERTLAHPAVGHRSDLRFPSPPAFLQAPACNERSEIGNRYVAGHINRTRMGGSGQRPLAHQNFDGSLNQRSMVNELNSGSILQPTPSVLYSFGEPSIC